MAGVGEEERWSGGGFDRSGWTRVDEGQSTSSLVHPEGETSFASCTVTFNISACQLETPVPEKRGKLAKFKVKTHCTLHIPILTTASD